MQRSVIRPLTLAWLLAVPFVSLPVQASPTFSVGFSPSYSAKTAVLDVINQAQQTLNVEAYSFTDKGIARALLAAKKRGVTVRIIADRKANSDNYTAVTFMSNSGLNVRLNDKYAIFHNKIILADGHTLQTGSYNYSSSADKRNAENVLVVRNQPQLVTVYQQEFERLWLESQPLPPNY
ncbi:phospholipase D family protein [Serratia marcescens]|jgi:phosphatidylserine/phosphatidylglycerophosphate/cardiolipin synthase-like enzyme|uniref:phospholipase D family nuclease n=1 Tax=Serratia TaxID=613 RepID=UPI000B33198F|nr:MULTISPECIES: phospholipase D family protein [Serratia]MDP8737043.1 phospholipase D family protein [Serratia marcescens]MDU4176565.1 phospholipase D family protein [Serratia liquefaciens]QDI35789.1 phospholipase D family protein [Serratia marcescens]CAI1197780.1 Phospholipase D precursor [Serratia liquefaciens]CAI2005664.1 Phospholipase D precursor [Serratia liquefaciens]